MNTGYAENTASNHGWLNTCPAVRAWIEIDDNWIEFQFNDQSEIPLVLPTIYFDPDAITGDKPESPVIDYGKLRDCLAQIGANVDDVVEWFIAGVDEADALRRSNYCYDTLAKNLERWYSDEREANADSKQHALAEQD